MLQHFLETGEDTAFLAHVQRSEDPHRVVAAINEEIDLAPGDLTRGARPQRAISAPPTANLADRRSNHRLQRISRAGWVSEPVTWSRV